MQEILIEEHRDKDGVNSFYKTPLKIVVYICKQ